MRADVFRKEKQTLKIWVMYLYDTKKMSIVRCGTAEIVYKEDI